MRSIAILGLAIVFTLASSLTGQAQSTAPVKPSPPFWGKIGPQNPLGRKETKKQQPARPAKPADKPLTPEEEEATRQAEEEERIKFGPPQDYHIKYRDYLTSEKRGLVRLFADKNCGRGPTVTLAELERCADVPAGDAGGSVYNFRAPGVRNLRSSGWLLHYENAKFEVGNDIVQGVIADIGDIDLEKVGMGHDAFDFLKDYDARQDKRSIIAQKEVLAKGIAKNGYTLSNSAAIKKGSTYALRSVIYRYAEAGAEVPDRGFDQYVVFKVVGMEEDGSVIIIWKELKRDLPRRQIGM